MGLDNPIHIAFLLILLLLVFGAKRLPEMGKSLGEGMRGFKDAISGEGSSPTLTAQQQHATPTTPAPQQDAAQVPVAVVPAPLPAQEPIAAAVAGGEPRSAA
jgi:sec-independent protein translocase protein TatA